jgi:hypothetical protein
VTWRALALLAGYLLLFPPLFVLGPLAGLLAASRPTTIREWAWIGAAALWLLVTLGQPGGLASQTLHAWALFVTAAFVVLMLPGRRALVAGSLFATLFGLGAATGWAWALGTRWHDIQLAVAHAGWDYCRQLLARLAPSAEPLQDLHVVIDALGDVVGFVSELFPALLVLTALPGLALAWAWYHRIARRPIGAPAGRFAQFRFNDQLIWLVVVSMTAFVVPLPAEVRGGLGNVALVACGLYAARGAAIAWGAMERFPAVLMAALIVGAVFILPAALGGFFAIGLADTWVDFRRRFQAADARGE